MNGTRWRAQLQLGRTMCEDRNALYPRRKRPIHQPIYGAHNRSIIIFLTVCTKDRRPVLANVVMHETLRSIWRSAGHWRVGRYVVLPDHLHLFCAPGSYPPEPLTNWVKHWKGIASKRIETKGSPLWEKNFWDTQLRAGDSYAAKWEYVRNNPVRHGLVDRSDEWPYQGELNLLRWHA